MFLIINTPPKGAKFTNDELISSNQERNDSMETSELQQKVKKIQGWQKRVFLMTLIADASLLALILVKWSDMSLLWINQINSQWMFPYIFIQAVILSVVWQAWLAWYQSQVQPELKSFEAILKIIQHSLYLSVIPSLIAAYTAHYGINDVLVSNLLVFLMIDFGTRSTQRVLIRKITLTIDGRVHV